jgi:hypothetical protein
MHPSLYKLMRLIQISTLRRLFRGARTPRGAFLIIFTIAIFAMMMLPSLFISNMRDNAGGRFFGGMAEPYLAPLLLGTTLMFVFSSAGEKALYFSPPEVDFLFPAPFGRRDLLVFKLAQTLLSLVFMAFLFSLSFLIYLNLWLSAFVGTFLALAFVQLLALSSAFLGQIVAEQAYTRRRRLILLSIGVLVFAALAQMLWQTPVQSPAELARNFRASWTGMVVLAPFEVFSHAILATRVFPDLICWSAGGLAINLALLALIFRLDADYLESAAAVSQKLYEKIQRMKQGGGVSFPVSEKAARTRLPRFPWLGGAGPLAWRQTLIAMRTSRFALIISLGIAATLAVLGLVADRNRTGPDFVSGMGVGFTAYLTFIFSMQLPWAFRGDIEHMDSLKTLPITPLALAAGELAGGVVVLAVIQLVVLAALLAAEGNPAMIMTAAAFIVPFDVLMLGVSNLLFLVYPVRLIQTSAPDFQLMGRMMLLMLLQFLILIPSLGLPAASGALVFWASGLSWPAFAVTSWLVLLAELPMILIALAWVFQRFDPSTDMPG